MISVEYIKNRFDIMEELGSGCEGMIYDVFDYERDEEVALKSQLSKTFGLPFNFDIFGKLEQLKPYTDSILTPKEWMLVESPVFLESWEFYHKYNKPGKLGVISIYPILEKFNSFEYTSEDLIDIAFELLVVLILFKLNGITHNDFGNHNVVIRCNDTPRNYVINGISFVTKSKYQPVVIDWGATRIDCNFKKEHFRMDWSRYFNDFVHTVITDTSFIREIKKIDLNVIYSEVFKELRIRSTENSNRFQEIRF